MCPFSLLAKRRPGAEKRGGTARNARSLPLPCPWPHEAKHKQEGRGRRRRVRDRVRRGGTCARGRGRTPRRGRPTRQIFCFLVMAAGAGPPVSYARMHGMAVPAEISMRPALPSGVLLRFTVTAVGVLLLLHSTPSRAASPSWHPASTEALYRCEKILDFATLLFSFICGKYYLIMD